MKMKLVFTSTLLFGLALSAQAQLLSLSIGCHGFHFGIGLPFLCWGSPAVYAPSPCYAGGPCYGGPAPTAYAPSPLAYADPAPPVSEPPVWVPSGPLPGKWVPEPHPYSYTPAPNTSSVPTQTETVTVTKGAGGMLIYSSRSGAEAPDPVAGRGKSLVLRGRS